MLVGSCDTSQRIALVAEIGNNHEGSESLARELVEAAFENGADAVKFQTYVPESYVSLQQSERLETLRRFSLSGEFLLELIEEYRRAGRTVFSTPFDLESLRLLCPTPLLKISSGDLTFEQLLVGAAEGSDRLIVSTGASTDDEVDRAVEVVRGTWGRLGATGELALLHCVSAYPAPDGDANLRCISGLSKRYPDVTVGFSDHTVGLDVAVLAGAAGARIIEKHFTVDKCFSDFRDHQLSAEPSELRELRERLDQVEVMLGDGVKRVQPSEAANVKQLRRSVTAIRYIPAGTKIQLADLAIVRPGGGLPPNHLNLALGRTPTRDIHPGEALNLRELR
jgi:N,N'-diacetyllegionaminate synthase